jgi:transposase InsO family protein
MLKKVYEYLDIKPSNSLPYVPRQNGAAEKLVSVIKTMLAHFAESRKKLWDQVLPFALMAYNAQHNSTTSATPQQMVYGFNLRNPMMLCWGPPPIMEDPPESEYLYWLRETLYDVHEYARNNMQAQIQRVKDRFDKKQYGEPFKENDLVWKLKGKFEKGTRAFQRKYDGIYLVLKVHIALSML